MHYNQNGAIDERKILHEGECERLHEGEHELELHPKEVFLSPVRCLEGHQGTSALLSAEPKYNLRAVKRMGVLESETGPIEEGRAKARGLRQTSERLDPTQTPRELPKEPRGQNRGETEKARGVGLSREKPTGNDCPKPILVQRATPRRGVANGQNAGKEAEVNPGARPD